MKPVLLFTLLIAITLPGLAQPQKTNSILIVRFEGKQNPANAYYYTINAELGNAHAPEVYGLVYYNAKRGADNRSASLYPATDSSGKFFNYFKSPTAAMEYLGGRGWQLISVISEVTSSSLCLSHGEPRPVCLEDRHPIVQEVNSCPVYYFKKEIE